MRIKTGQILEQVDGSVNVSTLTDLEWNKIVIKEIYQMHDHSGSYAEVISLAGTPTLMGLTFIYDYYKVIK